MIKQRMFGKTLDGREVLAFTLESGACKATILNYGGILQSLIVPDRKGREVDVLLGYHDVQSYERNGGYLGALIGRFGNRIGGGRLTIDGREYSLFCNDRGNHLHGGKVGFNRKIWKHEILGDALKLTLFSPDGEENYPGNLTVEVVYTLQDGELKIVYRATSDKKTAVNLTNHAYFNLNGESDGSILDNVLFIDSDMIAPTDPAMVPEGGFRAVRGTPFDFNEKKEIGRDIDAEDLDLLQGNGYDHCYILKKKAGEYACYAEAESAKTGIRMRCYTDAPAVQFYAGNGLHQEGKHCYYGKRAGFCLETQAIPNNVNVPEYAAFGNSILDAGQLYTYTAAYRFDCGE